MISPSQLNLTMRPTLKWQKPYLVGERAGANQSTRNCRYTKSKNHCRCFSILKTDPAHSVKALLVQGIAAEEGQAAPVVALFFRGDHELNEIKAEKHPLIAAPLAFATEAQLASNLA